MKKEVHSNRTRTAGNFSEDRYKFLIISGSVLVRMKCVLDKNRRGNQNTHFIFSIGFSEIVPFVR
jgi:hypothetical protein